MSNSRRVPTSCCRCELGVATAHLVTEALAKVLEGDERAGVGVWRPARRRQAFFDSTGDQVERGVDHRGEGCIHATPAAATAPALGSESVGPAAMPVAATASTPGPAAGCNSFVARPCSRAPALTTSSWAPLIYRILGLHLQQAGQLGHGRKGVLPPSHPHHRHRPTHPPTTQQLSSPFLRLI